MKDEQGSTLPLFAALLFTSFVMIALVVELALLSANYRTVAAAADAAAESGAAMLSTADAYDSKLLLDTTAATAEAKRVAAALSRGVSSVSISGTTLCVIVSDVYLPSTLLHVGVSQVDLTVESCAEPRRG